MNLTRRKLVGWIIAVAALCLAWFLYSLFGPNPPIIVSRETTYITEPLGEDGLPDYVAYWVQQASEGVTPENNASVLIWQAIWPADLEEKHWRSFCAALGMQIPSGDESLVPADSKQVRQELTTWLADRFDKPVELELEHWEEKLDGTAYEVVDEARERPWTSEKIPALAHWVKGNERPIDLFVQAAERPRYYSPAPSLYSDRDHGLVTVLLPDIQNIRTAARSLKLRAMQRLGDGQLEEAWKDLRACHRLARLTAQDATLVSQLVAIAVNGITCTGTQQLLAAPGMSERLSEQILVELSNMGSVSDIARSLDQGERLYYLDTMLRVAKGDVSINELVVSYSARGLDGGLEDLLSRTRIDWNQLLESGNRWYDRFTAAMRLDTRTDRLKEYDRIDRKLHELDGAVKRPLALLGSLFSRYQRGEMVGDFMLAFSLPSLQASSNAQDRSATTSELTRLAAALAVYRARHGEYPDNLAALVPDILPELPLDLYSNKPFHYQRKPDGGYLLYSVFENGVDDGGTHAWENIVNGEWVDEPQDVDWNKSDLVIRVPVPPFRLPDPPVAE